MIHLEYRCRLSLPPELAFDYIANPAHDAEWQASCLEAELLDVAPAAGSRYRVVFRFMGRRVTFVSRITEHIPHSECAFEVVEGPFHYQGRYSFRPAAAGTEVHWQFWVEPAGFFGIVPLSLLRKMLVSQVEKDLAGIDGLDLAARPAATHAA